MQDTLQALLQAWARRQDSSERMFSLQNYNSVMRQFVDEIHKEGRDVPEYAELGLDSVW